MNVTASNRPVLVLPIHQTFKAGFVAVKVAEPIHVGPKIVVVGTKVVGPVGVNKNAAGVAVVVNVSSHVATAVDNENRPPCVLQSAGDGCAGKPRANNEVVDINATGVFA